MADVSCPLCRQPMEAGKSRHPAWNCSACELTWVPHSTLNRTIPADDLPKLSELAIRSPRSDRELICPNCDSRSFRTISLPQIDIDHCYYCEGLVLDPQELLQELHGQMQDRTPIRISSRGWLDTSDLLLGEVFDLLAFLLNPTRHR